MKRILTICIILLSFFSFSQDQYKYEPVANTAEYYVGTFNGGKDLDDLTKWYGEFAKWADTKGDTYSKMSVGILTPYFHHDLGELDVVWVNNWPNSTLQFKGLDMWTMEGGKLLSKLPVTNSRVVNADQWVISSAEDMSLGDRFAAHYDDCTLMDGFDLRQVYDLYMDFALYAQSVGDTTGRKMIVPASGYAGDADFVRLLYSTPVSNAGINTDLYVDEILGSDADSNLTGFECKNRRTYIGVNMKQGG